MIDFVKATLINGETILINELKIEAVWVEKSKDKKECCYLLLENGNRLLIKPNLFYNWINNKGKGK